MKYITVYLDFWAVTVHVWYSMTYVIDIMPRKLRRFTCLHEYLSSQVIYFILHASFHHQTRISLCITFRLIVMIEKMMTTDLNSPFSWILKN